MTDRAQFTTPRVVPAILIGGTVVGLVGREIVAAQRAALAECAPDCHVGAPLFAPVGLVDAALVAIPLLGIVVLSWVLFRSGIMPRRIGGERDE
jgi:hypothetical protein